MWKVSASQLAKALSSCMLPIGSRIFPMCSPRLRSGPQRVCGNLFLFGFSFSTAVMWRVCRNLAAEQDIKISEYWFMSKSIRTNRMPHLQFVSLEVNFQEIRELKTRRALFHKWELFVHVPKGIVLYSVPFTTEQNSMMHSEFFFTK